MSTFNAADYWENRLRGNVALENVGYLGLGRHYNQWLYRVRETVFRKTVMSLNMDLANSSVLDIGSGTGFYVQIWKDLGVKRIVGLDITTAAVEHLKSRFPDTRFHKADIAESNPPLGSPEFDLISAFDILFHIVDDANYRQAVDNISSLLKPGGLLLTSGMFAHNEVLPCEHVFFRPLAQTEAVLQECGLRVLGRRPVFVLMSAPLDSSSRSRKHLWGGLQRVVSKSELMCFLSGALLYPVEVALASVLKESCSTEIMICKKEDTARAPT